MIGGTYYEFFNIKNEEMEKMSDNMCEAANAFGFLRKERDELQKELKRLRTGPSEDDKIILNDYLKVIDRGNILSPSRVSWIAHNLKQIWG